MTRSIEIVEVGPRDGLQNEARILDVETRVDFIERLHAAGARRIEAVSFVNPRRVPQMAGAEAVMEALRPRSSLSRIGLVLNMKGWDRAVAAGCEEANIVVCATDGFGVRNQGATTAEQIEVLKAVADRARREGPPLSMTVSVAFGCPFDGEVDDRRVLEIAETAYEAGVREIAIADTIGVADPWKVGRLVGALRDRLPKARLRLHFHDTRRTGLANAFAGVEAGCHVLDASCGGIGGCPFAPNATGNIATEDLVFMLERAGVSTGLDLDAVIAAARWIAEALGMAQAPSALSRAGPFPV